MNVQVVVAALAAMVAVKPAINTKDVMAVCSNAVYQLPGSFYVQGAGTIHRIGEGKTFQCNVLAKCLTAHCAFMGIAAKAAAL